MSLAACPTPPPTALGGDAPAPGPLHTTVLTVPRDCQEDATVIVRLWARAAARACRLCPAGACVARPTGVTALTPGCRTTVYACQVAVAGPVDPDSAPLFRLPGPR